MRVAIVVLAAAAAGAPVAAAPAAAQQRPGVPADTGLAADLPKPAALPRAILAAGYGAGFSGYRSGLSASGGSAHLQASVPLVRGGLRVPLPGEPGEEKVAHLQLRGELFYQWGTLGTGGTGCAAPGDAQCIGRHDRVHLLGATAQAVLIGGDAGSRVRPYIPVGLGVYHQRAAVARTQFAPADCMLSSYSGACSVQSSRTREQVTLPGFSLGAGAFVRVRGWRPFVEMKVHAASTSPLAQMWDVVRGEDWEDRRSTGAILFTVGLPLHAPDR